MKTLIDREGLVFNPPGLGCVLSLSGLPGGSSKIYDRSPYGKVGLITGATWVRLPSGLWCLNFDGLDDTLTIPSMDFSAISNSTLSIWVYLPSAPGAYEYVYSYYPNPNKRVFLNFGGDGKLLFAHWDDPTQKDARSNDVLSTETWYHIVGLMGAGGIKMYINGVSQDDTDASTVCYHSFSDADVPIYFGMYRPTSNLLKCQLALPRIYSRALSAFEIQNHFNQEKHLFGA